MHVWEGLQNSHLNLAKWREGGKNPILVWAMQRVAGAGDHSRVDFSEPVG